MSLERTVHQAQVSAPSQPHAAAVPRWGWAFSRYVLSHTYAEFNEDNIMLLAAAVAFYAVLALVPAITATVSLYALISDPASVRSQFDQLQGLMPSGSFDLMRQQVERIVSSENRSGIWFIVSLIVALWSTMSGMKGLMDSLNVVYEVTDQRSLLRYNVVALAMTLGALAWLAVSIAGLVAIPIVVSFFPLHGFATQLASWLRWPALLIVLMIGLAALYRFGPHRKRPRWEWVSPGNLFAAAGWLAGSGLMSWYLSDFANYNATYGSLGAAAALMLWLWVTAVIVLTGAELNSEYYKAQCAVRGVEVEV
jgi:membrane protein